MEIRGNPSNKMQNSSGKEKLKEFLYVEQLIRENKYTEAFQILTEFVKKETLPLNDKVSSLFLQGRLLLWLGRIKESLNIAEQAYKESLGLEKCHQTIDLLNLMALSLNFLDRFDEARELIKQSEDLFKTITKEPSSESIRIEAFLNYVKGFILTQDDVDQGLKYLEYSVSLWEKINATIDEDQIKLDPLKQSDLVLYPITIMSIGMAMNLKGNLDLSIKYFKKGLAIAKEIKNKFGIAVMFHSLGSTYHLKGEIDLALKFFEKSLKLFKEIDNKAQTAVVFRSIGALLSEKGEYDHALKNLEKSLAIYKEIRLPSWILNSLANLIEISLKTDDPEQAQQYFQRFKQIAEQFNDDNIVLWRNLLEAMILKNSPRTRNRAKAEEIFKHIIEKEGIHPPSFHHPTSFETYMTALIHLCDLLLLELRSTNELEVLDELKHYITLLLETAEKSDSYMILCESYLFQAKLSLLNYDIKTAKRFLTQSHQIAERHGLIQLAMKISNENEVLLTKLEFWEKLKESGAPMADRLELARLDEHIIRLIQNHPAIKTQVSEEKVAIHTEKKICLVCRGDVIKFSYICECGAIYCENCARALTNLENVCWVCETQIDSLKPIKSFKEEKVKLEETKKK